MNDSATIAAIATAQGAGGIAIVRISGDMAGGILKEMFRSVKAKSPFESHRMMYGHILDEAGGIIDEVMAVFMASPATYTREDVAEIHCHGGGACAGAVLKRILSLGARMAEPGEFTKRAFLNGRVDLARAEAVMQLINANSQAAARASMRQLEGGVSVFVRGVCDRLTGLLALLEASTDFPDEVEEEGTASEIVDQLNILISEIEERCDPRGARILREGASIVLVGRPNVGKSSLMNALLQQERAIVTDIPGTTRDVLTERLSLGGVAVELSDTAGQRDTSDPVEQIGVDRARRAVDRADVVLIVLDAAEPLTPEDEILLRQADERAIVCLNKSDLEGVTTRDQLKALTQTMILELSAQTGAGLHDLIDELTRRVSVPIPEGAMTARRHIQRARSAAKSLQNAVSTLNEGFPLDTAAIDLRQALSSLTDITGENATEAVIDRVFADFCVGK